MARITQRIARSARRRPSREFTLSPEVSEALDRHCDQTHEPYSAVVDRALRRELGLQDEAEKKDADRA